MFMDMLTANAAAQHGHEYSPSPPPPHPSPPEHRVAFSPFSILGSVIRRASPAPPPASTSATDDPPVTRDVDPTSTPTASTTQEQDILVSPQTSRPPSSSSIASVEGRLRKRTSRAKTTFNLAHPPPGQKLHLRPKVLLQLQQLVPSRRPKPAYEVIPCTLLASRSTRRFVRALGGKEKLGPNDLLVVKAEEYERKEEHRSDEERWGSREVIGVICVGKKDDKDSWTNSQILMDDGYYWEVSCMPNGGYEFVCTDEHGLQLRRRWVPKTVPSRRVSSMSNGSQFGPIPEDKRFTFSTISSNTRRHPIIARMTRANLEILDSYTMPTATSPSTTGSPTPLQSPVASPSESGEAGSFFDSPTEALPITTDKALRKFILVTGIWVAFCENWSDAYNFSRSHCPGLHTSIPSPRPTGPSRSVSMSFFDSPRSSSPASATEENKRNLPKVFRSNSLLNRNPNASNASLRTSVSAKTSPVSSPIRTRGRRSNSTGDADLYPRVGSTRKRFGLALQNEVLAETEEERQSKRSEEIMRMKELALAGSKNEPVQLPSPAVQQDISRTPSPIKNERRQGKTQSAYNPVTTKGLWDSGVEETPGKRSRPTSLVVLNEKLAKVKMHRDRSKPKGDDKDETRRRKGDRIKRMFVGIFQKKKLS